MRFPLSSTDPAGKWKTSTTDASGNLVQVTEPDPLSTTGGTLVTTYTYNGANQLTQVSMPRAGTNQIRTFACSGSDLASSTNPENGTVTYQYDGSHHVTLRTDNLGSRRNTPTTPTAASPWCSITPRCRTPSTTSPGSSRKSPART